MTDEDEPKRGFSDFSDEALVAHFKDQVARGVLPFGLQRQVLARGIECLASDPEMQRAVERLMEASADNWASIKFNLIDPDLLSTLTNPISESTQRMLNEISKKILGDWKAPGFDPAVLSRINNPIAESTQQMLKEISKKMTGQWDRAGLEVDSIGLAARHSSFFDDATLKAITANSPRALHEELVQTLELGFGSIQEELAIQRETLNEQRDTQNHMKGSLQTLKENAPTKRTGNILLLAAIVAAVTGIASVAIALIVALNQTTHDSPQPANSASPSVSVGGQPSPTSRQAVT